MQVFTHEFQAQLRRRLADKAQAMRKLDLALPPREGMCYSQQCESDVKAAYRELWLAETEPMRPKQTASDETATETAPEAAAD